MFYVIIESSNAKPIYHDAVPPRSNASNFGSLLRATCVENTNTENDKTYINKTMSVDEMLEVEKKAAAAFKQGDLIGYRQYTKILNEWQQTIQESAAQIIAVEEVQQPTEQEITKRGLFPEDAPQSLKEFKNSLSLHENMNLFMAVAVQRLIANAYQDQNGHWNIRREGDQHYVDIFKQPEFSYTKLAEDMLSYLKFERMYLRADEFKAKEDVLLRFKIAVEGR